MGIYETLVQRGFIKQVVDEESLKDKLNGEPLTFYIGFDPTGDCLHIGHLLPLMCMAWLQRAGHHPIIVMGGGTAMVGDPSGKDKTREMLTAEDIEANLAAQRPLFAKLIDLENATILNNAEWLTSLNYIQFLRDIGKHFSVNSMIKAEGARQRLERGQGYSFIEFNYHLLQSYDFLHLYKHHNCVLQVGGDDQWFHFCGGMDLIRRETGEHAYAFTIPLLTRADGKKMGKTEKGAVWIDGARVSPFEYYQYWINVQDADAFKFMKLYTFLPETELAQYANLEGAATRQTKQRLAFEATALVHGVAAAEAAKVASEAAFSGGQSVSMPTTLVEFPIALVDVLSDTLCSSKSDARRQIKGGAIKLDSGDGKQAVTDIGAQLTEEVIVWRGKKNCIRVLAAEA